MGRREHNLNMLASLRDSDANREHIFSRARLRAQAMRLLARVLKRARANRERAATNLEMYLDDWCFHHSTPLTKENLSEAVADYVDRIAKRKQAHEEVAEQLAEEREEDDGMKDFPL